MRDLSEAFPAPFLALLKQITEAASSEDFERASAAAQVAIDWGRDHGDPEAVDRAQCNWLGVSIGRGAKVEGAVTDMQRVLMRSRRVGTRFYAAYYLSILYDQRRQFDKSLFYARLALEHAEQSKVVDRIREAWNRIGNVQIVQSLFREAHDTYLHVLPLLGPTPGPEHAVIGANLGYCLLMLEEHQAGFRKLMETRRLVRRLGLPNLEGRIGLRLAICYAYIELGRLDLAHRHGMAALRQGEQSCDPGLTEKALYLLGEVAKKAGDDDLALELFDRLERTFHPEQVGLADLLMAVESHRLVNLRA